MIATIIGGTGLTGSFLVQQLLADAAITKVISVSRRALGVTHDKLTEVLISDLARLPAMASQMRGQLYFCCLGTTIKAAGSRENFESVDHDAIVAFARIANTHGARSLTLVSSGGAKASSMVFYNQVKGRTEDDVRALGLRSLNVFRPGLLLGPRRERRLAEGIAARLLVPLTKVLPTPLRKSLTTEAGILAARMLVEGKAARPGAHVISARDI